MLGTRLLSDDQSCAPARHAAYARFLCEGHQERRAASRPAYQQPAEADGDLMGRAVLLLPGGGGALRARLLSIYRDQSRARWHGETAVGLQVVQLPGERRR